MAEARSLAKAPALLVLRDAWRTFRSGGGRLLAGAIAFNALLSLVPLFLVIVRVAALFTDERTARETLLANVGRWVGPDGAGTIGDILSRAERSGTHATVIGAIVLVWGATRLFGALRRSLDVLWGTTPTLEDTVKNKAERFIEHRLRGFALVMAMGVVLVPLSFSHAAISMISDWSMLPLLSRVAEIAISFVVTALLFAAIFRFLPTKAVPMRDAAIGGLITAALFTIGSALTGAYVAHQAAKSPFGAATSIVLLLVWVHYSAHSFLFGAAITAARAKRRGIL